MPTQKYQFKSAEARRDTPAHRRKIEAVIDAHGLRDATAQNEAFLESAMHIRASLARRVHCACLAAIQRFPASRFNGGSVDEYPRSYAICDEIYRAWGVRKLSITETSQQEFRRLRREYEKNSRVAGASAETKAREALKRRRSTYSSAEGIGL